MNRRVLITGCTGLLGSNLCFLFRDKYDVVGISRTPFNMDRVSYLRGDITDSNFIKRLLMTQRFDVIVHCAALTNVDQCERDPELAMLVNYKATIDLANVSNIAGSRFVFISTDAVFDGSKVGAYTEGDTVNPINVYGESKACAEEKLMELNNTMIVRTNMYGFNYVNKNSLSEWVVTALRSGNDISMFYDVRFSAMLVNDLCKVIDSLILSDSVGIMHVASSDSISKFDFGQFIKKAMNLAGTINPISVDNSSFTARRSKNMSLDSSKASRVLQIEMPSMREGIISYVDLYNNGYQVALRGAR